MYDIFLLGLTKFEPNMVAVGEDGRAQCIVCGSMYSNQGVARMHVIRMHLEPELFQCVICNAVIRHRLDFAKHVNRRHGIKGAKNIVKSYGIPVRSSTQKTSSSPLLPPLPVLKKAK